MDGVLDLGMATRRMSLENPDFEPTDEELRQLSRRAFADVPRRNSEMLAQLNAKIEEQRCLVMVHVAELLAKRR